MANGKARRKAAAIEVLRMRVTARTAGSQSIAYGWNTTRDQCLVPGYEKGPGSAKAPLFAGIFMVPEVGIEPTRTQGPEDFESSASTNFTTPAQLLS